MAFRDGVPVASLERGVVLNRSNADRETMAAATTLLFGSALPFISEPSQPFDAYQGSGGYGWPVAGKGKAGEHAEGVRFNLN